MSLSRIASRYAKSLLDLAVEQSKLDRVTKDIQAFREAVKNRDLYLLLKSPIINPSKKKSILETLFKEEYDELVNAFINIVLTKGREAYLPEIANEYMVLYKKHQHISTVKLTTASPLSDTALGRIKEKLTASAVTDEQVELETKVDPNLIGGFVIEFDNKLYDASVAYQIGELKKEFIGNKFVKKV